MVEHAADGIGQLGELFQAGGHALEAATMVRAVAFIRIVRVLHHRDVSELRMKHTVYKMTAGEDTGRLLLVVTLESKRADVRARGEFGLADDDEVVKVYKKAGAQIHPLENDVLEKWKAIARDTAWKDYAAKNAGCARLIKLAEEA